MRYFSEARDSVYAILNCRQRRRLDDAVVTRRLNTRELSMFKEMRQQGKSDSQIYRSVFPPAPMPAPATDEGKVSVPIELLSKEQLIGLLTKEIGTELETLPEMSVDDLRKMLLALQKRKGLRLRRAR